ncbi:hypothetical protein ACDA63_12870 [Uliginosibacterium sp. sgz301328]|uniref:hypothetical protein n=1 Tax=Uliginosibacterium sp. sgz301328 TaxID=3243764 RepID=UPI00359E50DE
MAAHSSQGLSRLPARAACIAALFCMLAGCSSEPRQKEIHGEPFSSGELVQSDSNRVANLAMRDNLASLSLILEKLYRRNPAQWRKTGATSLEESRNRVMTAILSNAALPGVDKRSVAALPLAFDPAFAGDRPGTLIYALGTMLVELYGGRTELYLIHGLDAQQLANASHNIEVAVWMLSTKRDPQGNLLLLSNEIGPDARNLSFEREFGRIMGRLELLAAMTDEKYRRSAIDYVQGLLGAPLMQFIPLGAVAQ